MMMNAIFLLLASYISFIDAAQKFVNNTDQRKICRKRTNKKECLKIDTKCAWNVVQQLCNEKGYQPSVQNCNVCLNPGQSMTQ